MDKAKIILRLEEDFKKRLEKLEKKENTKHDSLS